ncbi:SGNH/GDSL hydrolase family protein [Mucilaginibacter pallidiroseus]|nr:SGNH/GDSL hydrolase family protein [Mucilaginibacter pallidiroseus]
MTEPGKDTTVNTPTTAGNGSGYLALGDSYTIGESVLPANSFPYQLGAQLKAFENPVIIARTGWTTDELLAAINASGSKGKKFGIVTLLIGVNNQYRGYSKETYRAEFIKLLNIAIDYAAGNVQHVFVLSIPDWGVTPFAQGRDRWQISAEIDQFNYINKQEADRAGVAYVNITPISKKAANDASLTADDELHPSGKMYRLWVDALLPIVKQHLNK